MSVLSVLGAVLLVLLKGIGVLLLVVLTLAVVLLFCPFCADVQWENDVLTIRAGALGLTLPVFQYPAPEKPKKKKKPAEKKADQKPRPETPPRKKARLTLNILCTILRGAGRLTSPGRGPRRSCPQLWQAERLALSGTGLPRPVRLSRF